MIFQETFVKVFQILAGEPVILNNAQVSNLKQIPESTLSQKSIKISSMCDPASLIR
jgi:hypothetical protein